MLIPALLATYFAGYLVVCIVRIIKMWLQGRRSPILRTLRGPRRKWIKRLLLYILAAFLSLGPPAGYKLLEAYALIEFKVRTSIEKRSLAISLNNKKGKREFFGDGDAQAEGEDVDALAPVLPILPRDEFSKEKADYFVESLDNMLGFVEKIHLSDQGDTWNITCTVKEFVAKLDVDGRIFLEKEDNGTVQ